MTTRYRVWRIVNPPAKPDHFTVESPAEGARMIDALATVDLQNDAVGSNVFGLEVEVNPDDWEEWHDEEGYGGDVDELIAAMREDGDL